MEHVPQPAARSRAMGFPALGGGDGTPVAVQCSQVNLTRVGWLSARGPGRHGTGGAGWGGMGRWSIPQAPGAPGLGPRSRRCPAVAHGPDRR